MIFSFVLFNYIKMHVCLSAAYTMSCVSCESL